MTKIEDKLAEALKYYADSKNLSGLPSNVCLNDNFGDKARQALAEYEQSKEQARDWLEDAEHENGQYQCGCTTCNQLFIGHKRRIICKVCSNKQPEPEIVSVQDLLNIEHEDCNMTCSIRIGVVDRIIKRMPTNGIMIK